ncbi:MAG TPA: alkaline phosphatase family protein [Thermoanaerobaculia bacterium]
MSSPVRRIAAAGNTAAVALLAMVYAHGPALLGRTEPSPAMGRPEAPVLLVVIDALREDRSRDLRLMPNLNRLEARGVARVESWIPSTVAGIRTIAEGTVPPPASFLEDFGASRSPAGGIFAAAKSAGLRTFAAGPRLWEDLYGPWLDGSFAVTTVAADDEQVLREGIAALRSGDYGLVVVHLSGTDDVAHLHGGGSREYLDALRRADAALGRLLEAAGPDRKVIVTSDHGVTDRGGHAGPEPEVVETPVVVRGLGNPGLLRQRDLHRLIASPLGPPASRRQTNQFFELVAGGTPALPGILLCVLILCTRLTRGEEEWPSAILLDAALWISLLLAVLSWTPAALLLTLAVLGVAALRRSPRTISLSTVAVLAAGFALGVLRLLGETASLSTLDVRFAFRLADGPLGLPGAVAAVLLLQALPTLALLAGLAPALPRLAPETTGAFAAGAALVIAGQAAAAALALTLLPGDDAVAGSLAVGLLVRLIGEVSFLFLGLAAAAALAFRRGAAPARRPAAILP